MAPRRANKKRDANNKAKGVVNLIEDESDDFACFEDDKTTQKPNALVYSAQISASSTTPTSTISSSSLLTTTPPCIRTTEKVSNAKR